MSKYHVNPSGNPGKCSAKAGNCPYGGTNEHYDTRDEARAAYEASMDKATDALQSVQKEIGERRNAKKAVALATDLIEQAKTAADDRMRILGLSVVNRETGKEETFINMSKGELEMPGYLEHVERGYDGTNWRAERVLIAEEDIALDYCEICNANKDHFAEHDDLIDAGMAEFRDGAMRPTATFDPVLARDVREASFKAYDLSFSVRDPEKDSPEIKALKDELVALEKSPARFATGFPEDEMGRHIIAEKIRETQNKIKELDPEWDPNIEAEYKTAQTSYEAVVANARYAADPANKYTHLPKVEIKEGSVEYDDVVIASVQFNKKYPGTSPRNHEEMGRMNFIVPNVKRLTDRKKLAIAEEMYRASGGNLEKWADLSPAGKLHWVEPRIGKYSTMTVERKGDQVSWSNRYSSSNNTSAENVAVLDIP